MPPPGLNEPGLFPGTNPGFSDPPGPNPIWPPNDGLKLLPPEPSDCEVLPPRWECYA